MRSQFRRFQKPLLAIAAPSVEGQIAGCQLRPDEGGYFWVSSASKDGYSPKLPNGENPIGVYRPMGEPAGERLWFAEGLLKPAIAALRLNEICIGAAGGNFASSPEQVKAAIAAYPNLPLVLAADAGAVANPHVMRAYQRLHKLASEQGRELQVAWWGQTTKAHGDIDEISDFDSIEYISWQQFTAIAIEHGGMKRDRTWRIFEPCKKRSKLAKRPKPAKRPRHVDITYSPGSRLATWNKAGQQGYQYVLDISGTGGGKSFDTGNIKPEEFNSVQVIYATDQQRNPTTDTLSQKNGWVNLEARHHGLVEEPR